MTLPSKATPTCRCCPSTRHLFTLFTPVAAIVMEASRSIVRIGLALCAGAALTNAQTWQTVDDIFPDANATAITTDSMGRVFVAGAIKDASGVTRGIVMKSSDQGSTWDSDLSTPDVDEPADRISSTVGSVASFNGIACALVATGESTFEERLVTTATIDGSTWLTRRSVDAGATWATLDQFKYSTAVVSGSPGKPALDANGNIYVGGSATEQFTTVSRGKTVTTSVTHYLIRKFEAGVWRTIETPFPVGRLVCTASSLFAVSNSGDSWQVRKSTDGGVTWTLLDDYQFDPSSASLAYDAAADLQGNIYVVGSGSRFTKSGSKRTATTLQERFWIVRKGAASGAQWTTIDVFDLGRPVVNLGGGDYAGAMNFARGVTADANGNIWVTGCGVGPLENLQHWVTRRLSSQSGTWTTMDDFNLTPDSTATQGAGISADPFGNVFSIGLGVTSSASHSWLVRRQLAQ